MKSQILITGATGGLGKAFAVECASRGYDLFLTDLSEEALSILSKGLVSTYGIRVLSYSCNLEDDDSRMGLINYITEKKLKFRCLINVAGLDYEGPFTSRTSRQIRTLMRVNVEANLEITGEVLKLRDKDSTFRIINVASLAAFYPMPIKAMYAASKRFLLDFSLALREELKPEDVTVTALCPAGMPTTPGCRRSIQSQGFAGRITTFDTGYVAAKTIDNAFKGAAVYIPGVVNQLLKFAGSLVPPKILAHAICGRWKHTRTKKSLTLTAVQGRAGYGK